MRAVLTGSSPGLTGESNRWWSALLRAQRHAHELANILYVELVHDIGAMTVDRPERNAELFGDDFAGLALGELIEHPTFAFGKGFKSLTRVGLFAFYRLQIGAQGERALNG